MCKFFDFFSRNNNTLKDEIVQPNNNTPPEILIERFSYSSTGTFGILTCEDFQCFSVEPPWKDNQRRISCIPDGDYIAQWYDSPRFGETLAVIGGTVSLFSSSSHERSAILFHVGNWPRNFEGCIGLGRDYTCVSGQIGVTSSRDTINSFLDLLRDYDNMKLTIKPKMGTL